MGSYYYLMAQLPHLVLGQKPPMTSEAYKSLAKTLMKKQDAELLDGLSLEFKDTDVSTGCKFIDEWHKWERALRLNAAKHRAANLHREKDMPDAPYIPSEAAAAAAKALSADCNPYEGELIIDKARWNVIDELAGTDYFTRNHAYAYLLKLLILERRQAQTEEKGFSEYKSLYSEILENANESLEDSI